MRRPQARERGCRDRFGWVMLAASDAYDASIVEDSWDSLLHVEAQFLADGYTAGWTPFFWRFGTLHDVMGVL